MRYGSPHSDVYLLLCAPQLSSAQCAKSCETAQRHLLLKGSFGKMERHHTIRFKWGGFVGKHLPCNAATAYVGAMVYARNCCSSTRCRGTILSHVARGRIECRASCSWVGSSERCERARFMPALRRRVSRNAGTLIRI